jgi:hypothetical protein
MSAKAEYNIDVSPDAAFTITYDDQLGRLIFTVEVETDAKIVFLNQRPTQDGRIVDVCDERARKRVDLAVRRVIEYFASKGLTVELD